ncbi:hypothetical protein [Ornithinibacillus californiensis]|uniref:hypothetical protein n=1 Tax=Ornithinibacillus californiensis TaxID=161536 RepID=UPI00064DEA1C|nr:hypothetical protein [Ornithinibacillus californiensis]
MEISLLEWKALVEKKLKKKVIIKIIWNEQEKITLLITPNMKINSFIHDEKEGYLFYDIEGKLVEYAIPSILTEKDLVEGKIVFHKNLKINGQSVSEEEIKGTE